MMQKNWLRLILVLALAALIVPTAGTAQPLGDMSDEELIAWMHAVNDVLEAAGHDFRLGQIEFYTQGPRRPDDGDGTGRVVRILQQEFRWVANDPFRFPPHENITWLFQDSRGVTSSGVSATDTGDAIRRAMNSWDDQRCLRKVGVDEVANPGGDVTILDTFGFCPIAFDGFGDLLAADIVHAGWYPSGCFNPNTLAFSVTFFFNSDINGDNYLDTALNEVYFNDLHAWGIDVNLPMFDVETVALHESGHSLGVGHFGPPPKAIMNPVYAGIRQTPKPIDRAGQCIIWSSWPND